MSSNAMNRDEWPPLLRELGYGLFIPFPALKIEHINGAFNGVLNRPNSVSRADFLIAVRTALASDLDLRAELGFPHPDSMIREFLTAVEKRLSKDLGE